MAMVMKILSLKIIHNVLQRNKTLSCVVKKAKNRNYRHNLLTVKIDIFSYTCKAHFNEQLLNKGAI